MHGDVTLGGPLTILLVVLAYGSWGLALYVFVDAARRGPVDFAVLPESRWLYMAVEGLYFAGFAVNQFPGLGLVSGWFGTALAVGFPIAVVVQVAYLLRVTFPSHQRLTARAAATAAALESEITAAEAGRETNEPGAAIHA